MAVLYIERWRNCFDKNIPFPLVCGVQRLHFGFASGRVHFYSHRACPLPRTRFVHSLQSKLLEHSKMCFDLRPVNDKLTVILLAASNKTAARIYRVVTAAIV